MAASSWCRRFLGLRRAGGTVIVPELHELTAVEARAAIARAELAPAELLAGARARHDLVEPHIRAYRRVDFERAAAAAGRPRAGALAGLCLAIKDNIADVDGPTTCGSKILANYRSPYEAAVVSRVKAAGAVITGKTNLDEFAMGSSTENSAWGPSRNPFSLAHVTGGSSGGSASAVAAGSAQLALGSDTGGSIRQPAACCGVVGLKPTYGRVSRYGLVAFASSLDQIGPLARSVADAALLFGAIAGHDPRDATSARVELADYSAAAARGVRERLDGVRIGLPREYFGAGLDASVGDRVTEAAQHLERLGATVREVSLPMSRHAVAAYYVIATAEASSNLARFDGVRYGHRAGSAGAAAAWPPGSAPTGAPPSSLAELFAGSRGEGFGPEVKRRIILGTFVLSAGYYDAYYGQAQRVRAKIRAELEAVLQTVDLVLGPTMPTTAFRIGEKTADPLSMYLGDIYTTGANLAGIPALSLPGGTDRAGLPIGLQLMGRHFDEATILRVAAALEAHAYPPLTPVFPRAEVVA
ncbi:MAG: Asp-tRNA(Asn)/Glu-tRNA(Gln) amidotransferase subunit GatA [Candidatus Schekmanbacteria bacterium]|nr:Asp-tRNA(Asn)/Glu-tRNA(Gln) amidotransferase subunit GatA [Candidatus Schekmanbacteria bacterium]